MKTTCAPLARALPQADGATVRLRRCANALRQRAAACGSSADRGCTVETASSVAPIAADALMAVVSTAAGRASLAIDPRRWPALASAATLGDGAQRDAVAALLVGECLGAPMADLVAHVELRPALPRGAAASGVVLRCSGLSLDVLAIDESLLACVEAHVAALAPCLDGPVRGLRLPGRVLLGQRQMTGDVLRSLRVSDVVLLPAQSAAAAASVPALADDSETVRCAARLFWGDSGRPGLHASVLLRDSTMTLTQAPTADVDADADDAGVPGFDRAGDAPAGSATVRALGRLELAVRFELAGPGLRLAEIAALSAGDVLELPVPVDQARVRITVAGQEIGAGELVAVSGRLGVRILRMDIEAGDPSP